jgi:hypothetical protein
MVEPNLDQGVGRYGSKLFAGFRARGRIVEGRRVALRHSGWHL